MLGKATKDNLFLATDPIKRFAKFNDFDVIQDNGLGLLLVKNKSDIYIWDWNLEKRYNYNRIRIEFNHKFFFKQIDSFDQNNVKQSKNIRKSVLSYCKSFVKSNSIIGIGGEYYIYFPFVSYDKYWGLSNHQSIVSDADYNCPYSTNVLVDYNKLKQYPKLSMGDTYDVIINVINIHENIIKYICAYNVKNVVIITCKPLDKKISMLNKYLILKKITHYLNINSLITVCLFEKI
jgi:hypothetical protein